MPRVHEWSEWMDDDDAEEHRQRKRNQRFRRQAFHRHPSCDDPDHPGCYKCSEEVKKEEEEL